MTQSLIKEQGAKVWLDSLTTGESEILNTSS